MNSLDENFEHKVHESRRLTYKMNYPDLLHSDYSSLGQQNNLLHIFFDFMNTGNNTTFVLGSVFFLFQIHLQHKPLINHFVRDNLLDYYQELYLKASKDAIKSSVVLIMHSIDEMGYFNPGFEKGKLNFILKSSMRGLCSNLFLQNIYFESGNYSIKTFIPANAREGCTHEEALSHIDNVTYELLGHDNTMGSVGQPHVAIAMYSHQ
jgi:hypothetical protein